MRTNPLPDSDQCALRELIARQGLDQVAERLGVPRGTVARAAAGAPLLRVSQTAILARLGAYPAGPAAVGP
jgi:hypothetical protein